MTPRISIHFLEDTAALEALLEAVATTGYSRYPVTGDSLDDIRGTIDFKELARPLAQGNLNLKMSIKPWVKPVRFVPEFTPLSELLSLMQRSRLEMAIVVDEFGGTAGLISFRDLIDEIIGCDLALNDSEEVALQMLDEQTFLVQAQMNLEDTNELLELDLPLAEEYQTLGGFLLSQFQKIPTQGETLRYQNLDFTIVSADGPRLYQIRIHRCEPEIEESD